MPATVAARVFQRVSTAGNRIDQSALAARGFHHLSSSICGHCVRPRRLNSGKSVPRVWSQWLPVSPYHRGFVSTPAVANEDDSVTLVRKLSSLNSKREAFLKFARWKTSTACKLDGRHVAALLPFCDNAHEMKDVVERELTRHVALQGDPTAFIAPYKELIISFLCECDTKTAQEIADVATVQLEDVFGESSFDLSKERAEIQTILTSTASSKLEDVRLSRLKHWISGKGDRPRKNAERLFSLTLEGGCATIEQMEVVLALCTTSADIRDRMKEFTRLTQLKPSTKMQIILIEHLLLEGDRSGAAAVLQDAEQSMNIEEIEASRGLLGMSEDELNSLRLETLRECSWQFASRGHGKQESRGKMLRNSASHSSRRISIGDGNFDIRGSGGTLEAQHRTKALFEAMLLNGVATSEHLAFVVQACATSEEMRNTIATYMDLEGQSKTPGERTGLSKLVVSPGVEPFVELIKQVLIEGNQKSAKQIIQTEIPEVTGKAAPQWMTQALSNSEEIFTAAQSTLLQDILSGNARHAFNSTERDTLGNRQRRQQGQNVRQSIQVAHANANVFLRRMCRRGVAKASHFNTYLRKTSQNSDDTRFVMENTMTSSGVRPDEETFLILIEQLVMEGELRSATEVAKDLLPQALGVISNSEHNGISNKCQEQINYWLTRSSEDLSRMRTAHMKRTLHEGGTQSDWNRTRVRDFYHRLLANCAADKFQWNQYLMSLPSSDDIRAAIRDQLSRAQNLQNDGGIDLHDNYNFTPTEMDWSTLVSRLILEGDLTGAERITKSEAVVQSPNSKRLCSAAIERAKRQGANVLCRRQIAYLETLWESDVEVFGEHGRRNEAESFFEKLQENFANGNFKSNDGTDMDAEYSLEAQFGVLLKFCSTASEMLDLVHKPPRGVVVSIGHMNAVLNRLILEGDDEAAMRLVQSFPERNLEPNDRTAEALIQNERDLSIMRASLLHNGGKRFWHRLEQGGKKGGLARAIQRRRALAMWNTLQRNGKMDARSANKLMRWVCIGSQDIRNFIDGKHALSFQSRGEDGGEYSVIPPDSESYGNLVKQLVLEGDYNAANEVVEIEMPAAGIPANQLPQSAKRLLDAASTGNSMLSRMRTGMLCRWANEGTDEAKMQALHFFEELKQHGKIDAYHYSVVLSRFCPKSSDVKRIIKDVESQGIKVDKAMINILVRRLVNEEKYREAQDLLENMEVKFPNAGQWRKLVFNQRKYRLDLV